MASILYVGTDEGVVTLTSEDGRNWKQEHHALKQWAIPEVAVAPDAPNKVYAGTRGDGVGERRFRRFMEKPATANAARQYVPVLRSAQPNNAGTEPIDVFVAVTARKLGPADRGHRVSTVTYPVAAVNHACATLPSIPKIPRS
jgi:hypothetical protein